MIPYKEIGFLPLLGKVPFLVPIDVLDGSDKKGFFKKNTDSKLFFSLLKRVLQGYGAETDFLLDRMKGGFKKVKIVLVSRPKTPRVVYSPITGVIELNTDKTLSVRSNKEGVQTNLLFALGMAYYDFGLSNADRLYWRVLTNDTKVPLADIKKSLSFGVTKTGKRRTSFAIGFLSHFKKNPLAYFERFFEDNTVEIDLPSDRFQVFRSLSDYSGLTWEVGDKKLTVKEALDLTGITALTSDLKKELGGANFHFELGYGGVFSFHVYDQGTLLCKMKRRINKNSMENLIFYLAPELQGKGRGLAAFSTQVNQAIKNGLSEILTSAERDDSVNMVGYDVWWRFGFDGQITQRNASEDVTRFLREAANANIYRSSDMTAKRLFFDLLKGLKESVERGELLERAYQYMHDTLLGGRYRNLKGFNLSRDDLKKVVIFFNEFSPLNKILIASDLSFQSQRMQRLLELEGFEEFWSEHGKSWQGKIDLKQGAESPSVAVLSNYVRNRTATSETVLTQTGGDFQKKDLINITRTMKEAMKNQNLALRVALNVFK